MIEGQSLARRFSSELEVDELILGVKDTETDCEHEQDVVERPSKPNRFFVEHVPHAIVALQVMYDTHKSE